MSTNLEINCKNLPYIEPSDQQRILVEVAPAMTRGVDTIALFLLWIWLS